MRGRFLRIVISISAVISVLWINTPAMAILDTHYEDFDDREDGASISGVGNWIVEQGEPATAITQHAVTQEGTGKSLELTGAETAVNVTYDESFERISPTWIEFTVRPGDGNQTPSIPENTIAAVTFDPAGKIYASDGDDWIDTGETYTSDEWYRVMLKVDFSAHLYDVYITEAESQELAFSADRVDLAFADPTISSVSQLNFGGAYNSISATDDTYIDNFVVHFIDRLEFSTASQILTKDQPSGPITVQLQNASGEPQTAWQDFTLELQSSSSTGEFSLDKDAWAPISQITVTENAQQSTFYYKDSGSGNPIITLNEYPARGWTDALQQQKVISEVAGFDIAVETPQVAGKDFKLTITAKDDEGDINIDYSGEIELTAVYMIPNTGMRLLNPFIASGFSEGILLLDCNYADCGAIQISVTDRNDISKTGSSGTIIFVPESIEISCNTPQVVGKNFPVGITAYTAEKDEKGNNKIALNYVGPVTLESVAVSPPTVADGSIAPSLIGTEHFEDGEGGRDVKFDRWGTIKIKASDQGNPTITVTSGDISFRPDGLAIDVIEPSSERSFFYVGEDIEVVIEVVDADDEPIKNYLGSVSVYSTIGLGIPEAYEFVAADEGRHAFIFGADTAGIFKVMAQEVESGMSVESPSIIVKKVYLEVVDTESPLGTAEITVQLVDEEGNLIISESDLTLTVDLEEENSNLSAVCGAILKPVTFNNGIARILIANTEAEYVTVIPKARYNFDVRKGTVKFGKISKKGIGVLMWRELKTKP